MKIVFLTEHFLPKTDGVVTRLCHTLLELKKLGHEPIVITYESEVKSYEGVPVYGLKALSLPWYRERKIVLPNKSIYTSLSYLKPDFIHVINYTLMAFFALRYAKKNNIPAIFSYHTNYGVYLKYYGFGILRPIEKLIRKQLKRFDSILCSSAPIRDLLKQDGLNSVHIWQKGVDIETFYPDFKEPLNHQNPKTFELIYVGRLAVEKRIEWVKTLLQKYPNINFSIVGDGPHKDKLEAFFQGTNTKFLGYQNKYQLSKLYAQSDLLVLPSDSETLGLVLLESMASGCPVLAAKAGGIPDIVKQGEGGLLFEANNQNALLETFEHYYHQPEIWNDFRIKARQIAEFWSWPKSTQEYLNFCDKLMVNECLT